MPLADRQALEHAGRATGHGLDARRDRDGPSSCQAPDVRRAVPSRVDPDQGRQEDSRQLRPPCRDGVGVIETIAKLVRCENLTEDEAAAAFEVIMRGDATPSQIAGFVVALRMKGETVEELTGFARTARAVATPIRVEGALLDTCGTGGDGLAAFNISTLPGSAAPAGGARAAPHGNRAPAPRWGAAGEGGRAGGADGP